MKTYYLFISHSWNYTSEYKRLVKLLKDVQYFRWKNFSVSPEYCFSPDKIISRLKLRDSLSRQIKPVSCVLIIGGKYINYGDWIKKEIELSKFYSKPIIGVLPWGIRQTPEILKESCIYIVGWNMSSIVHAIKKYNL